LGSSADRAKEEQALRAAIATDKTINDPSHWTDDVIFVSGRYPKPLLGKQQYEAANKRLQADPTERRANEQRRFELVRLEVAEAGDMAYGRRWAGSGKRPFCLPGRTKASRTSRKGLENPYDRG
jgi:ketosteroid isomerase-like protein